MPTDLRRLLFSEDFDPEEDTAILNEILTEIYDSISGKQTNSPQRVKVNRTTNQSVGSGSFASVSFNNEQFNPSGMWDDAEPTRITFRQSGVYIVNGRVQWDGNATNRRELRILKNGTTTLDNTTFIVSNTTDIQQQVTVIDSFNVNDYVQLQGFQNSGGNLNIESVGSWSPRIEVVQLASIL